MPSLFVSHAASDRALARPFVKTVLEQGCKADADDIFFSSGAGTGVEAGAEINADLRSRVAGADLVIAIVTPAFLASAYCLTELGAAWGGAGKLVPLLVPGVVRSDLQGILGGMALPYLDDAAELAALHDRVCELLGVQVKAARWGEALQDWLGVVGGLVAGARDAAPRQPLSVTSCSREPGHLETFWTDGSGRVFYRWWLDAHGWSQPDHWDDPAATHVAALSRGEGDQLLFGVDADRRVWMRRWSVGRLGWMVAGDPEPLPGDVVGPLSAASLRPGHVELTAWTPSGELCHLYGNGDDWTPWTTDWPHR